MFIYYEYLSFNFNSNLNIILAYIINNYKFLIRII